MNHLPENTIERPQGSLTYFIYDGQYVKIGKSGDIAGALERVKTCQTGNAKELSLIGVSSIPEQQLHDRFEQDHVRGEWFRLSHELLRFLASPDVKTVDRFRCRGEWIYVKEYV